MLLEALVANELSRELERTFSLSFERNPGERFELNGSVIGLGTGIVEDEVSDGAFYEFVLVVLERRIGHVVICWTQEFFDHGAKDFVFKFGGVEPRLVFQDDKFGIAFHCGEDMVLGVTKGYPSCRVSAVLM